MLQLIIIIICMFLYTFIYFGIGYIKKRLVHTIKLEDYLIDACHVYCQVLKDEHIPNSCIIMIKVNFIIYDVEGKSKVLQILEANMKDLTDIYKKNEWLERFFPEFFFERRHTNIKEEIDNISNDIRVYKWKNEIE